VTLNDVITSDDVTLAFFSTGRTTLTSWLINDSQVAWETDINAFENGTLRRLSLSVIMKTNDRLVEENKERLQSPLCLRCSENLTLCQFRGREGEAKIEIARRWGKEGKGKNVICTESTVAKRFTVLSVSGRCEHALAARSRANTLQWVTLTFDLAFR